MVSVKGDFCQNFLGLLIFLLKQTKQGSRSGREDKDMYLRKSQASAHIYLFTAAREGQNCLRTGGTFAVSQNHRIILMYKLDKTPQIIESDC